MNTKSMSLTNGQKIEYQESMGSGISLIMIHGLGSNYLAFKKLAAKLLGSFHMIMIDLPKYLNSDNDKKIVLGDYVDMIYELCIRLRTKTATLVGHSMGGQISVMAAYKYPAVFQKIVLLAPAGFEIFTNVDRRWFATHMTKLNLKAQSDITIKRNFDINFYGGRLPEDAQFMYHDRLKIKSNDLAYDRYTTYLVGCVQAMLNEPIIDILSKITQPTLVLFGETDMLIPNRILHPKKTTSDIAAIANLIPDVQIETVAKAGHFVLWDAAGEVAKFIKSFY